MKSNPTTTESIVAEFEEKWSIASFTWNGDNSLGAEGALATRRRMKRWLKEKITALLEEVTRCRKTFPDGSICTCKLDCHLHDWRQKDFVAALLEEKAALIEGVKKAVRNKPHGDSNAARRRKAHNAALQLAAQIIRQGKETV